jgi:alanine-glyoxylate transaminase / serine-glyoxylate transaminase / serine-pyruvate transaminase
MGSRRHHRRVAERADAAARPVVQRGERQGARRGQARHPAPLVLGLAGDAGANANGFFPYTPATNLLYGLAEAIDMLHEEGLDNVFARHQRHSEATRRAVQGWGLEVLCLEPRDFSHSLTAVVMPEGHNADAFRAVVLENFNMSLGNGLSKLAGTVFRIGHLGDFNDLMLMGTICGVEMGLAVAGVPHQAGGAAQAMTYLKQNSATGDAHLL